MTGLPFVIDEARRRRTLGDLGRQMIGETRGRRLGGLDSIDRIPPRATEDEFSDIVPKLNERRPFRLDEIANASIVGSRRPTTVERIALALEAAGRANTLDPYSENPVESFLGSALGTFSGVQGEARAQRNEQDDLAFEIAGTELTRRAEERRAESEERLRQAQTDAAEALAFQRWTSAVEGPPEVDAIVQGLRDRGLDDVADFVESNPGVATRAPSVFARLATPDEGDYTPTERAAMGRVERTESRARSELGREQRELVGGVVPTERAKRATAEPEARLGEIKREFSSGYPADSALAARARARTGAQTPPARPAPPQAPRELQDAAGLLDPGAVPLDAAVSTLKESRYSAEEIRTILTLAGYSPAAIDQKLGRAPARPR